MRKITSAFAMPDSRLGFVVVLGNPGIGKTNTFRKSMADAFVLECNVTPFGLYTELYENRNTGIIVLDDVDTLMSTAVGLNLLKALLQTDSTKRVSWNTAAADKLGIPRSFTTSARMMMFANKLGAHGKNLAAVLDRGHLYRFMPTAEEVHAEVATWMTKKEIKRTIHPDVYEFIGKNLRRIVRPTFRDYVRASEQLASGLGWKINLTARWDKDPKLTAAAEILRLANEGDPTLATSEQRAARFAAWGHGVRSTYMLYQAKVMKLLNISKPPKAPARRESTGTSIEEEAGQNIGLSDHSSCDGM